MAYSSWDAMKSHVAMWLSDETGTKILADELVTPPKPDLGDVCFGCFKLAKATGKNPAEIAKELASKLAKGDQTVESATAAGPYVNVIFKTGDLINRLVGDIENAGEEYGMSDDGKGQELMFEYAQPNTHKEIHVGHLRNLVLGVSLVKLLKHNGWNVIPASYHGDVGAHVAKCLWLLVRIGSSAVVQAKPKKKPKKGEPEFVAMKADEWTDYVLANLDEAMAKAILAGIPKTERTGATLGRYYAEAAKLLDENPDWKEQVSQVQHNLEAHIPGWEAIWHETRRWSVDEMAEIFDDLGVAIKRQYFESEVVDEGQRMVDELISKKVARESQGAIVVDLEEEKLGMFLIRKSDGTSLYATKDLALAKMKFEEYRKLSRSLIMVDNRQALYFKQLFRTLELMKIGKPQEFIGYEFVTLKSGAMSSRDGNVVTYQDFRKEVVGMTWKETQSRHDDWSKGRLEHTSWALAMGGIKYGMLKQDPEKLFTFDLERALSFDGDTGPYVQYAATRLGAILKKANWDPESGAGDLTLLTDPSEKRLVLHLAAFPVACRRSAIELKPSVLAQWCFTMAQEITKFYHDVNVLESEFGVKQARLRLIAATQSVLIQGLDLLGIPMPDEM